MDFRQSGDDLALFALEAQRFGEQAHVEAVRKTAYNTANELRRIIRRSFGAAWRAQGLSTKGFAATIRVKQISPGHYRVYSKATYAKGRSQMVDLLWVFDTAPVVRSGRGKANVAVPIVKHTPETTGRGGRRFMSPSEAIAAGWEVYFATIFGKPGQIAFGRQNRYQEFKPMWVMKPAVKEPKRLDLDGLHRKHAVRIDDVWAEIYDRKMTRASVRRVSRIAA